MPYTCTDCGASGVKLWREYSAFASKTRLLCARCAMADQDKPGEVDDDGRRDPDSPCMRRTDQIGYFVPAVPTEHGTFWGYTSVPQDRVEWWRGLPTYAAKGEHATS